MTPDQGPGSAARGRIPTALLLALGAAALYVATLAPGVLWGDDAELQRLATAGPVHFDAHGHPLWLVLARAIARIPLGSVAWRVNLLSALCAAAAVGVLCLAAARFTDRRLAAALAAAAFAVSHTHWLHAVRAEVYALYVAMFALTLLAFSALRRARSLGPPFVLGLLAGASLLSHLLIVTAVPGLLLGALWLSPPGRRTRSLAALAAGALPGSAVFLALSGGELFWNPAHPGVGPLSILSIPRPGDALRWVVFGAYQFPLASPLVLWGAWRMLREDAPVGVALAAIALGDVGFTLCFHVADQYVFYLPSYVVAAVFLAWGVRALGERWTLRGPRLAVLAALLVLAPPAIYRLAPGVVSRLHLALVSPRTLPGRDNNRFFMFPPKTGERGADRFARGSFAALPESALVIADWAPLQPLRYLQEVERSRPDLELVESRPSDPRQVDWITAQSQRRPVFIADDEPPPYYDIAAIRRRFTLRPVGPMFQLVRQP